jgi:hypothetical protein
MKKLQYLLILCIGGGVVIAWYTVIKQFIFFFNIYGDLFRFKDCAFPNPIITPCFWGAVAFIFAFVWSLRLVRSPSLRSARGLRGLLVFGSVFAFSVLVYEGLQFYQIYDGPIASCAPGVHPLKTPCFAGFIFFTLSAIISFRIVSAFRTPPSGDITASFTQQ